MKNKKLTVNSVNKNTKPERDNESKMLNTTPTNKIGIKNHQIKKEVINKNNNNNNTKSIQHPVVQVRNNNNNKVKINDYFNLLIKDTLSTSNDLYPSKPKNNLNVTGNIKKEKLQLKIPDSFKNTNIILPPVNYCLPKKINNDNKNSTKTKQIKINNKDNNKVILKKRGLSTSELKKCLIVIYDDIMMDNYENNQEQVDKTNNTVTTMKTNHDLNSKEFYNLFINEINICYGKDIKNDPLYSNKNEDKSMCGINDNNNNICQLRRTITQNKSFNKMLDDIYSLNINDVINNNPGNTNNNDNNMKNSGKIIKIKPKNNPTTTKKIVIQQSLLSSLNSPINSHNKNKRKFSSSNLRKINTKQTKLNFITKRQKTI
ncbi:hypothetical protein BCR32DRAFT_327043 [Anaeromyces robustus]|uniref:Uncharacterized protein n=1 Tax=Anaeromyces robustus TaxID=1754192 RepID=A0A1Y1X9C5_9FUNG|nr:hypothetical protein BCR32DRAFT_327043 [Anaeromyces robustus]|eukprot:ORX82006.1 hypothetical protein BCR32DRAFT_327043 [Anaeromyces robustus]